MSRKVTPGMRKFEQVAASIRSQIADGTLKPGQPAPSGAALSRGTGFSALTCRKALRVLIEDGVLVPGTSRSARPRVRSPNRPNQTLARAKRELSAALADRRHAAGLTQPELAAITGDPVTSFGHAETGRLWQSRAFWERADKAVNADGELLRLHDAYRAAAVPPDFATMAGKAVSSIADTAGESPATEGPPAPSVILIVWTDGAITAVPITRDA